MSIVATSVRGDHPKGIASWRTLGRKVVTVFCVSVRMIDDVGGRAVRVNVVYDNQGNILAAGVAGEGADQFVVQEGERVDEFDAPGELADGGLAEFLENLRVDVDSKELKQR